MGKKVCLHISANQFPNLSENHFTKKIWLELSKEFEEYHIIGRSKFNKFEHFKEGNIYLHLVPALGDKARSFLFSSFYIFKLIPKYKITHLLAQSSILGGFTAALASRVFKIPLMTEVHGEEYFRYFKGISGWDRFWTRISKHTFNTSQKVRSLNALMTQKLSANGIVNIVEIPNRVDLSIFNNIKENFKIDEEVKIISIGRFVKEKNYLELIRILNESGLNFRLTLVGGGVLKAEYLKYIEENAINEKIVLIDWIEQKDLVDLIINSDIYIQYSISEGMPRTIIEAMALQMPIISTDVGSIKGVLTDNYNCKLVKWDISNHLIEIIQELLNDHDLRRSLATNARNDVCSKYEWNMVFAKYRNELSNMT